MARLLTLAILVASVFALSWNPGPSSPIAPGALEISWSGWPFVYKQTHRNLSPTGVNQVVHEKFANPELSINIGVAIAIVSVLYVGLTRFALKNFPRFTMLDILALTVGISIATAYFAANPDTHLWHLRYLFDGAERNSLHVLQRPIWQNGIACILIVLTGYSATLMLATGQRWITNR